MREAAQDPELIPLQAPPEALLGQVGAGTPVEETEVRKRGSK